MGQLIDMEKADRYFASALFNTTWDLIEKAERSERETELMLHTAHASFCHWLSVPDRGDDNLSIGYWQLSRVYSLARRAPEALVYARRCLEYSQEKGLDAFFMAYAHEALARAQALAGDQAAAAEHLAKARSLAATVDDAESRRLLEDDLAGL